MLGQPDACMYLREYTRADKNAKDCFEHEYMCDRRLNMELMLYLHVLAYETVCSLGQIQVFCVHTTWALVQCQVSENCIVPRLPKASIKEFWSRKGFSRVGSRRATICPQ
jgi:hypothetical protein